MQASPSYIYFRVQWQILGPESPGQRFDREKFQKFFEKLNASKEFGGYDDFSYRADRCEFARKHGTTPEGGQVFSKVVYEKDSLSVVEEWTDLSSHDFSQKIKLVLDAWFNGFPETIGVVQSCWVRALAPRHFQNSRDFLVETVLRLGDVFRDKLTEMPHSVGFSFASQRKFGVGTMNFDSKVSSWRDGRSIWIEVHGVEVLPEPLNVAKHDKAEAIFGRCKGFLETEMLPILDHYDENSGGTGEEKRSDS